MKPFSCLSCLLLVGFLYTIGNAQDTTENSLPVLELLPSDYISVLNADLTKTDKLFSFEATFTVNGRGIYGHFDMTLRDEYGEKLQTCSTGDLAYRRDRGAKVKSITLTCPFFGECRTVQIFFHEMRLQPDNGPCMNK